LNINCISAYCGYASCSRTYLALKLKIPENIQKFNMCGLLGMLLGARPTTTYYTFRQLILQAQFASQIIVCLYLSPLNSYTASKSTMLKIRKNTTFFGLMGTSLGVYRLMPFILESCRPAAVILIDM